MKEKEKGLCSSPSFKRFRWKKRVRLHRHLVNAENALNNIKSNNNKNDTNNNNGKSKADKAQPRKQQQEQHERTSKMEPVQLQRCYNLYPIVKHLSSEKEEALSTYSTAMSTTTTMSTLRADDDVGNNIAAVAVPSTRSHLRKKNTSCTSGSKPSV